MGKLSFSSYIEVVLRVKFIIDRENEGAPVHYWEKFGASANWARLGANAALLIHSWRYTKHKYTTYKSKSQRHRRKRNTKTCDILLLCITFGRLGALSQSLSRSLYTLNLYFSSLQQFCFGFGRPTFWWHLLPIKFTSLCSQLYIMYTTVYIVHRTLNCIKVVPWKHFQLN